MTSKVLLIFMSRSLRWALQGKYGMNIMFMSLDALTARYERFSAYR